MTIQSFTQGPGTLELGAGPLDASAQVAEFAVECTENVKKKDPQTMLSGEVKTYPDTVTHEWKATGVIQQELETAGLIAFSWANMGVEVPFTFIPATAEGKQVTGELRVVPIKLGGKSGEDNTSSVTWAIIGTPVLENVAP